MFCDSTSCTKLKIKFPKKTCKCATTLFYRLKRVSAGKNGLSCTCTFSTDTDVSPQINNRIPENVLFLVEKAHIRTLNSAESEALDKKPAKSPARTCVPKFQNFGTQAHVLTWSSCHTSKYRIPCTCHVNCDSLLAIHTLCSMKSGRWICVARIIKSPMLPHYEIPTISACQSTECINNIKV